LTWIKSANLRTAIIEPMVATRSERFIELKTALTLTANRARLNRARRPIRLASMLLAVLFLLLRPVCDVFAASGDSHAAGAAQQGYVQLSHPAGAGHSDDEVCCSSVQADALAVPAIPPLPVAPSGTLAPPSDAFLQSSNSAAKPMNLIARRDPAPPLPYHARSLRRLD